MRLLSLLYIQKLSTNSYNKANSSAIYLINSIISNTAYYIISMFNNKNIIIDLKFAIIFYLARVFFRLICL